MENNKDLREPNTELQELDDILSELHDLVQDVPEVEPDEELQQLLDLPEITVTPVVVKEPEIPELLPQEDAAAPEAATEAIPAAALEGETVLFTPVTEEAAAEPAKESEEPSTEDTIRIPGTDTAPTRFTDMTGSTPA